MMKTEHRNVFTIICWTQLLKAIMIDHFDWHSIVETPKLTHNYSLQKSLQIF